MEKILCAAIWYKEFKKKLQSPKNITIGVVVCGHSHANCISTFNALTGLRSVTSECGQYEQGFLTDRNKFVDRVAGYIIAVKAKQVDPDKTIHSNQLFSEDLY